MMNADLLDLDAQNSSIIFNNWRAQPIENGGAGKPALHAYTLEEVGCKLPCQEPIQAKFLPKLFEYYNKSKSLLIVDTGGYDYDLTRITLLYADYILSPVGLSAVERFGLESFETILKKAEEAKGRPVKTHGYFLRVLINTAKYWPYLAHTGLLGWCHAVIPKATYVVNSGYGLHLYYLFDDPVPLYPKIQRQLKEMKYELARHIWNKYTSTIQDVQQQGIAQGFRMVGS